LEAKRWVIPLEFNENTKARTSDVARPLSYKTKTVFFFKDHQITNPSPLA